jgi:hypothetical protein
MFTVPLKWMLQLCDGVAPGADNVVVSCFGKGMAVLSTAEDWVIIQRLLADGEPKWVETIVLSTVSHGVQPTQLLVVSGSQAVPDTPLDLAYMQVSRWASDDWLWEAMELRDNKGNLVCRCRQIVGGVAVPWLAEGQIRQKTWIIEFRKSNVNGHYPNGDGSLDARMSDRSWFWERHTRRLLA